MRGDCVDLDSAGRFVARPAFAGLWRKESCGHPFQGRVRVEVGHHRQIFIPAHTIPATHAFPVNAKKGRKWPAIGKTAPGSRHAHPDCIALGFFANKRHSLTPNDAIWRPAECEHGLTLVHIHLGSLCGAVGPTVCHDAPVARVPVHKAPRTFEAGS